MNKLNSVESALDSCPDPWLSENSKTSNDLTAKLWPIPQELHPLISPAGRLGDKQLVSRNMEPMELLLQDWLKLKTPQDIPLAQQWQEAVALIYWMEKQAQAIN